MKVLIILEDQESDRYIAKPVIEAMLADLKLPAQVDVLPEPRLRGADQALDPKQLAEIVSNNPQTDLFLLLIDRDCNRMGHEARAQARVAEHSGRLLACLALQELEVWMLALHKSACKAPWTEVRQHCDPKEKYAEPLLEKLGTDGPGGGRKQAMRELKGHWKSLRTLCEELQTLQLQVKAWAKSR